MCLFLSECLITPPLAVITGPILSDEDSTSVLNPVFQITAWVMSAGTKIWHASQSVSIFHHTPWTHHDPIHPVVIILERGSVRVVYCSDIKHKREPQNWSSLSFDMHPFNLRSLYKGWLRYKPYRLHHTEQIFVKFVIWCRAFLLDSVLWNITVTNLWCHILLFYPSHLLSRLPGQSKADHRLLKHKTKQNKTISTTSSWVVESYNLHQQQQQQQNMLGLCPKSQTTLYVY